MTYATIAPENSTKTNSLEDKIDWHPRFTSYVTSTDKLALISEEDSYLFSGDPYTSFIHLIDGTSSMSELLASIQDISQALQAMQVMTQLLKQGILYTVSEAQHHYYKSNRVDELPAPIVDNELLCLYNFAPIIQLDGLLESITISEPITIVVTNDYLDPRVATVYKDCSEKKRFLLLLKLTGKQAMAGPLFSMEDGEPCYQCLATQLLNNQPVRHWLMDEFDSTYIPLNNYFDPENFNIEAAAQLVRQAILKKDQCLEWDTIKGNLQTHKVHALPQCESCGDPILMKQQLQSPVSLDAELQSIHDDGGLRIVDPETTLHALKPFISPLTGVITDLNPIGIPKRDEITIYRTAFFTKPSIYDKVNSNSFFQLSLGKGVNPIQSQVSALCETVERYAAHYQGDEYYIHKDPDSLESRYYLPQELAPFSDLQYQEFRNSTEGEQQYDHAVAKYSEKEPLYWLPSWSLTADESVYVPFSYCFKGAPLPDYDYLKWNSNGAAAGNCIEEAILQGLLELIERDATAIWWYNKLETELIDISSISSDQLDKIHTTLSTEWDYWLLNFTTDANIPVVGAIGKNKVTQEICFGFGCHLNMEIACLRALTELCQLIPIRNQKNADFDFSSVEDLPFLRGTGQAKSIHEFELFTSQNLVENIDYCVQNLKKIGLETLVVDYSRPNLPISTAKVIVPGLCYNWPQLGNIRLFDIPVKMGYFKSPLKESQLNPMGLYI